MPAAGNCSYRLLMALILIIMTDISIFAHTAKTVQKMYGTAKIVPIFIFSQKIYPLRYTVRIAHIRFRNAAGTVYLVPRTHLSRLFVDVAKK